MKTFEKPTAGIPNEMYIFSSVFFGKSSMPGDEQVPIAKHQGAPICSHWSNHVLITGSARAGKTSRVIIPTLLRYSSSMLVIDPDGESAAVTARSRPAVNSTVHIVNPWGLLQDTFASRGFTPATYNPLDVLDRNDQNAVSVAKYLAAAICPPDANATDAFFSQSASNVITALLLWLADSPGEEKTLGRLREIVTTPAKDFQRGFLAQMRASEAFGGAIREFAGPLAGMLNETFAAVMAVAALHTAFLSTPQIKAVTARSSFSMTDLMKSPTTVYIVNPPAPFRAHQPWLRLMVSAAMQAYKRATVPRDELHRCMFLLDDFLALGRFDELVRGIGSMQRHGADFTLFVPGFDQLKQVYGDASDGYLNNCAYKWFCSLEDFETAQYVSDALGKNPAFTPDKILALGRDTAILLAPGEQAHYLRTVDYKNLQEAFKTLKAVYPHLYWDPPLKWDKNPSSDNE